MCHCGTRHDSPRCGTEQGWPGPVCSVKWRQNFSDQLLQYKAKYPLNFTAQNGNLSDISLLSADVNSLDHSPKGTSHYPLMVFDALSPWFIPADDGVEVWLLISILNRLVGR